MIVCRAVLTIRKGTTLPYVGQKPLRLKQFMVWQGLTFALMFHFLISTNIVNEKR